VFDASENGTSFTSLTPPAAYPQPSIFSYAGFTLGTIAVLMVLLALILYCRKHSRAPLTPCNHGIITVPQETLHGLRASTSSTASNETLFSISGTLNIFI